MQFRESLSAVSDWRIDAFSRPGKGGWQHNYSEGSEKGRPGGWQWETARERAPVTIREDPIFRWFSLVKSRRSYCRSWQADHPFEKNAGDPRREKYPEKISRQKSGKTSGENSGEKFDQGDIDNLWDNIASTSGPNQ
jgi:hypothetical protein